MEFKDGDIIVSVYDRLAIIRGDGRIGLNGRCYFGVYCWSESSVQWKLRTLSSNTIPKRLATEEEKQKLFNIIREGGYHWNHANRKLTKIDYFE